LRAVRQAASGRPPINDYAAIDLGLDAAGPLLGERLVIERSRLHTEAGATDLHSPELAPFLERRHGRRFFATDSAPVDQ